MGAYWECLCDICGESGIYYAYDIDKGFKTYCCRTKKYFNNYHIGEVINGIKIIDMFFVKGYGTLWQCLCPYCKDYFLTHPINIVGGKTHKKSCGCISKSAGEAIIDLTLKSLSIDADILREYSFKDLKSIKNRDLYFDFAIFFNNRWFLIEYDGNQHEDINSVIGVSSKEEAEYKLEIQKKNDKLKDIYAEKHNYPLLRIKETNSFSSSSIERQVMSFLLKYKLYKN